MNTPENNRKLLYAFTAFLSLLLIASVVVGIVMVYRWFHPEPEPQIIAVSTPDTSMYREKTPEEEKYGVKIYKYELSDEEFLKLQKDGYSQSEIENMSENTIIEKLYGKEASINNQYITKNTSLFLEAKEPDEKERTQILNSLIELYKKGKFSELVAQFGEYQKSYCFEHFWDADINALYHDASQKIGFASLDIESKRNKMGMRQSVYGVVFDLNTIGGSISVVSDRTSCLLIGMIDRINSVHVHEDFDKIEDPLYLFVGTDLVYEVRYTTREGYKGTVWVGDRSGYKYVIKVRPDDACTIG